MEGGKLYSIEEILEALNTDLSSDVQLGCGQCCTDCLCRIPGEGHLLFQGLGLKVHPHLLRLEAWVASRHDE